MNADQAPAIALVVEAEADDRTARRLVDRALREGAQWLLDADLDHHRSWQVVHWKHVRKLCAQHDVVVHGGFGERAGAPDARTARRALMLLARLGKPAATVLLRDADNQPERRIGLEQARDDHRHELDPQTVAIGVADPCREAWHLAGFRPRDPNEERKLAQLQTRLSLDPTREPERLARQGERDIKKVLAELTDDDHDRIAACLDATDLHQRGRGCGLSEFLDELRERVVPAFTGRPPELR